MTGLLFHDLRRTGARNMRRMGIHETIIMKIGGWKTRSAFDRYNIVDQSDLADAARRMEERHTQLVKEQQGRNCPPMCPRKRRMGMVWA